MFHDFKSLNVDRNNVFWIHKDGIPNYQNSYLKTMDLQSKDLYVNSQFILSKNLSIEPKNLIKF